MMISSDIKGMYVQPTQMTEEIIEEENYYDSLELLALCVEAEASNQGLKGKRLVADVILNRVDSEDFPNTIEEVIKQPKQFSTWSNGMIEKANPTDETFEAVKMELEERLDDKILFFTAGRYNTSCIPAYKHKDHYFGY